MRLSLLSLIAAAVLAGSIVPAMAESNEARAKECAVLVDRLTKEKIIYGARKRGGGIELVVDKAAWDGIDFEAKTKLVKTVVCVMVDGDPQKTVALAVRDNMRDQVVGRYSGARLEVTP